MSKKDLRQEVYLFLEWKMAAITNKTMMIAIPMHQMYSLGILFHLQFLDEFVQGDYVSPRLNRFPIVIVQVVVAIAVGKRLTGMLPLPFELTVLPQFGHQFSRVDSEVEFVVALSAKHNHQTVLLALGSVRPTEDMVAVGRLASAQEALHSDSLTIFSMILPSNSLVSIACLHPFDCRLSVQEPSVAVIEHSDINIFVADFELEVVEIPVIDNLDLASEYADEFVALLPLVVFKIVDTAMESREHDSNLALQTLLQVLQFRQFG
jgi:hypothetical protein